MKRWLLLAAGLAAVAAQAEEPRGLPEPPQWVADPDNPNRPKPPEGPATPETFGAPEPAPEPAPADAGALRRSIEKSATPVDRVAAALKPQTRHIRPGQLGSIASSANDGDTIILAPGTYRECGIWRASRITIRAERPGTAVIDGVSCDGKGLFVLKGNRVAIDGLVFRNASVRDRNGAGIRGEGQGLLVRRSHFINNENGILLGMTSPGQVVIEDSVFDGNGTCEGAGGCSHGIYIGAVQSLTVRRSTFINTNTGHHVKSRARTTLVENCIIDDHAKGNSSYLIDTPNGGAVTVRNNLLIKGPRTDNSTAFIAIGMEGVTLPTPAPRISRNRFINRLAQPTFLVVHTPRVPAPQLEGNSQSGRIRGAVFIYRP